MTWTGAAAARKKAVIIGPAITAQNDRRAVIFATAASTGH